MIGIETQVFQLGQSFKPLDLGDLVARQVHTLKVDKFIQTLDLFNLIMIKFYSCQIDQFFQILDLCDLVSSQAQYLEVDQCVESFNPGDLIYGDVDGVVVIPQEIADEVINKAWEKVRKESNVRDELRSGASVVDTFKKYGIL